MAWRGVPAAKYSHLSSNGRNLSYSPRFNFYMKMVPCPLQPDADKAIRFLKWVGGATRLSFSANPFTIPVIQNGPRTADG